MKDEGILARVFGDDRKPQPLRDVTPQKPEAEVIAVFEESKCERQRWDAHYQRR